MSNKITLTLLIPNKTFREVAQTLDSSKDRHISVNFPMSRTDILKQWKVR